MTWARKGKQNGNKVVYSRKKLNEKVGEGRGEKRGSCLGMPTSCFRSKML